MGNRDRTDRRQDAALARLRALNAGLRAEGSVVEELGESSIFDIEDLMRPRVDPPLPQESSIELAVDEVEELSRSGAWREEAKAAEDFVEVDAAESVKAAAASPTMSVTKPVDVLPAAPVAAAVVRRAEPQPQPAAAWPPANPEPPRKKPNMLAAVQALSTVEPRPWDSADDMMLRRKPKAPLYAAVSAIATITVVIGMYLVTGGSSEAATEVQEEPAQVTYIAASHAEELPAAHAPKPEIAPAPTVESDKSRARQLARKGMRTLKSGRMLPAKKLFVQALQYQADNRVALEGLGRYHLKRKQWMEATAKFKAALRIEPRNADVRILLGDAQFEQKLFAKAHRNYRKAKRAGHPKADERIAKVQPRL